MCIINHILSHMHGCSNWCHETSSTLSMHNCLNPVCHCQYHLHTLTFISTTLTCISLNPVCPFITITLVTAFTSAPFWRRISTTSLCPLYADVYTGVRPSWGIEHGHQTQNHKREHGQQTNDWQYPFIALLFNIQENANTTFNASEYNTSISFAPRNMLFLLAQPIDAQMSQKKPTKWDI